MFMELPPFKMFLHTFYMYLKGKTLHMNYPIENKKNVIFMNTT